jgi:hypothetical protein
MKTLSISVAALFLLGFLASPVRAQIVITAVGSTGYVNQQPGLSNDFIDFFSGNYPMGGPSINNVSLPSGTVTSDYSSFSFAGGVAGGNSDTNNFSTITTPQGQSFLTGVLRASSGSDLPAFSSTIAFAVEPTGDQNVDYNDFYIYVMYSNTNGTDNDGEIWVAPRSSVQDGGPYGEGTRTVVTSLDDNANSNGHASSPSTADYLIFHVTGLGTAITDGDNPDLVIGAYATTPSAYVGGISFAQAIPEPSTWAMLLTGSLGLLFLVRRNRARCQLLPRG